MMLPVGLILLASPAVRMSLKVLLERASLQFSVEKMSLDSSAGRMLLIIG